MRFEDVETFIYVCKCQSISQAASDMFLAQSTVSLRLQRLEENVGQVLFIRKPGKKEVVLTPQGAALLPLAEQYTTLGKEMQLLSSCKPIHMLSIGATASVYDGILPQLFSILAENKEGIRIKTVSSTSLEFCQNIDGYLKIAIEDDQNLKQQL